MLRSADLVKRSNTLTRNGGAGDTYTKYRRKELGARRQRLAEVVHGRIPAGAVRMEGTAAAHRSHGVREMLAER